MLDTIDTCNDIHEVVTLEDGVDGKIDGTEQINGTLGDDKDVVGVIGSDSKTIGVIAPLEEISATLKSDGGLSGDLEGTSTMQGDVLIGNCIDAPPYRGDYIITPKVDEQIMATRQKVMFDDVTIKAIPYYETANVYGTTIYIGE